MKPHRPLGPSIIDIILALLLAAVLVIPWTVWRLVRKIFGWEAEQ